MSGARSGEQGEQPDERDAEEQHGDAQRGTGCCRPAPCPASLGRRRHRRGGRRAGPTADMITTAPSTTPSGTAMPSKTGGELVDAARPRAGPTRKPSEHRQPAEVRASGRCAPGARRAARTTPRRTASRREQRACTSVTPKADAEHRRDDRTQVGDQPGQPRRRQRVRRRTSSRGRRPRRGPRRARRRRRGRRRVRWMRPAIVAISALAPCPAWSPPACRCAGRW